ncbi:MAG TPA: M56 family metallopeptidase [Terracidiphilus sp.]|nr:M56 family metallopeptidase [Terracidiphilus sp.]
MLTAVIEAALRSLVLALMVWAGLRLFRIRNVVAQRGAWTAVLIGSLLMPVVVPISARWRVLPFATIPAPSSLHRLQSALASASIAAPVSASSGDASIVASTHVQNAASRTAIATPSPHPDYVPLFNFVRSAVPEMASPRSIPAVPQFSRPGAALILYIAIAAALLARLLFGLAVALRLWYSSAPVAGSDAARIGADLNLRFSRRISTPITIGSGVVLPADYRCWAEEKLRIVLAHERSHVSRHDFHLQILASAYAALTWFSPLGWWLKHKLCDLGEAISDRSGLDAASNRSAYAQVLLEFAAMPRPTLTGVAMARSSSISRRIERLLNDRYLRHAFAGGARAGSAVLILPAVLFAASALVHVQAATQSSSGLPAANAATASLPAAPAIRPLRALPGAPPTSATSPAPAAPAGSSRLASTELALANFPAPADPPAALQNEAAQSEASFDRNLTFNGKLDLSVSTASGNITFTRGPANQIHIHGVVKANKNGDPAQVQQIAANPPIEQDGNTIRIGTHGENLHNISISYEIEAPADTSLNAATASGNITDTEVGEAANLITASGNITATGLGGGFKAQTGSGNIAVEGAGEGDAKAQTGSGNIELKGVNGALNAQTGSGTIKAAGKPSSPWKLQTGSGTIELATGNAPMDLDASTGSGSISTTPSITTQGPKDHHHIHTQLNGGGPEVRVETGSGDIRID